MRNKPLITRTFYKCRFLLIPCINRTKLRWKDKFGTPSVKMVPRTTIEFLWFGYYSQTGSYDYWEQMLWVTHYNNGDVTSAIETWPWRDYVTKESTWDYTLIN